MNAFISAFLLSHRKSITPPLAHVLFIQDEQYAVLCRRKASQ